MRERQEIEPASSTPTPRTVRNAPSEMACPYAAVFRLSSPLVAHSAHAWPFAVATATRFRRCKRSRLADWDRSTIVTLGIRRPAWRECISRTTGLPFYFNATTGESTYNNPTALRGATPGTLTAPLANGEHATIRDSFGAGVFFVFFVELV